MVGAIPYLLKGNGAYHMTMDARPCVTRRVKAAIGEDLADRFWIGGHVNVNANGTG